MSFDPQLLSLLLGRQVARRRDAEEEEERRRARRDAGFQFGLNLATQADGFDVKKAAPFLAQEFGVDANQLAFITEMQKQRTDTLKQQQQAQEATAQAGFGEQVLTDPQLAPELGISQVLSALRDVERAGLLQDQQLGTSGGAEQALANVDVARTKAQVTERDAVYQGMLAEAKTLRKERFSDENSLRSEFVPLSKPFLVQKDAFDRVQASAESPDAAGDLALIFNYLKVLDPGSTVREGEFEQVGRAGGLPGQAQAFFAQVDGGKRLTDKQRQEIVARSRKLFQRGVTAQKALEREFKGLAQRNGLDARNVVIDFVRRGAADAPPPPPEEPDASFVDFDTESGNPTYIRPDGTRFEVVP